VIEPTAVTIGCDEVPHASRAAYRPRFLERAARRIARAARDRDVVHRGSCAFCGTPGDREIVDEIREILIAILAQRKRPGLRFSVG